MTLTHPDWSSAPDLRLRRRAPKMIDVSAVEASARPPSVIPIERDLASGERVGDYVVEGEIGRGAFGVVYRGVHPLIGKQVAIKVLSRRHSVDPAIVSRFVTEARVVNRIRHPNIIDIFAFGQLEDGRHYHVMELLDGQTLEQLQTARGGKIAPDELMTILEAVAKALDSAHEKDIIHRDLKPENVFLVKTGDGWFPKLLDFGIAKLLDEEIPREHKTGTGMAVGTPYYMSPEQCRGQKVDRRTDVYSFGVMVFQLLAGRLPFVGRSTVDVLVKHVHEAPPAISSVNVALPASLDPVLIRMLEKDPERRIATVGAAVDELKAALAADTRPRTLGELEVFAPPPEMRASGLSATAPSFPEAEAPPELAATAPPAKLATDLAPVASAVLPSVPESAPPKRGFLAIAGVAIVTTAVLALFLAQPAEKPVAPVPAIAAPVEAAPAAPPEAPELAPATVEKVTLHLTGTAGAEVIGADGTLHGRLPCDVVVDKGTAPLSFTVRAPGHVAARLDLVPDADRDVETVLRAVPKPKKRSGPTPAARADDLEPWN